MIRVIREGLDAVLALRLDTIGYKSVRLRVVSPSVTSTPGVTVLSSDILVRCTWRGDATLDGKVDILDLYLLAMHWHTSTSNWHHGDFTGNGYVDSYDLTQIATHWQDGTSFSAAAALLGL